MSHPPRSPRYKEPSEQLPFRFREWFIWQILVIEYSCKIGLLIVIAFP
jgi:hypothetical protein